MIDAKTDLYCIFGNPVGHSKSPLIQNACFIHYGINAAYLAFETKGIKPGTDALRNLNIKGASVTIPFKENIIEFLDEISEDAKLMGAVNTVLNKNKKLYGFNTDCMAAISPLKPLGIKNKKVAIIGAGGAAQAVAYGIDKEGGSLIIINRTVDKGERLASKFHGEFFGLNELEQMDHLSADIIINTTSIGMHPHIEDIPISSRFLNPSMIVMDVVYTPLKTRLLKEADQKGCTTIDGLSMFLHQGAAQFKIWTGISPDIEIMRQAILNGEK